MVVTTYWDEFPPHVNYDLTVLLINYLYELLHSTIDLRVTPLTTLLNWLLKFIIQLLNLLPYKNFTEARWFITWPKPRSILFCLLFVVWLDVSHSMETWVCALITWRLIFSITHKFPYAVLVLRISLTRIWLMED